jgi:hypothetical protein
MKYDLLVENWNNFLNEEDVTGTDKPDIIKDIEKIQTEPPDQEKSVEQQKEDDKDMAVASIRRAIDVALAAAKKRGITSTDIKRELTPVVNALEEAKKKKSGDRCTRIAKRKYKVWPSAYASGAVVKCRQGKIWKGISESATDEEIDYQLLMEQLEIIDEKWSEKYKRSIDCNNPKGFSQKAHCQGRKKNEEIEFDNIELIEEETIEEAKKKRPYKPNFSKEKEQGLHGWFARNKGKGWINCRTGGPCGRSSADKKGGKYPACRPTKAQCKSAGKGPLRKKKSSKPISWTKKKKD